MAQIERQAQTHHRQQGLPTPPPIRNQVRSIPLQVDALPGGRVRVSTPLARGWAAVASNPHELARVLAQAWMEAQLASYARWQGEMYELDVLTEVVPGDALAAAARTQEFRHRKRNDQYNPADWALLPDGNWRSPSGRSYRPDTAVVGRVRAARRRLGIE